jgi:hypothetical protein
MFSETSPLGRGGFRKSNFIVKWGGLYLLIHVTAVNVCDARYDAQRTERWLTYKYIQLETFHFR